MKLIAICFASLFSSSLVMAQSIPTLPKNWQGTVTVTTFNKATIKKKADNDHGGKIMFEKGWNHFQAPATLKVLRQEGRHLELEFRTGDFVSTDLGTISADGKQIQITFKTGSGVYNLSENKIAGCGSSRGADGLLNTWFNSYASWCDEFTVATAPAAKK